MSRVDERGSTTITVTIDYISLVVPTHLFFQVDRVPQLFV